MLWENLTVPQFARAVEETKGVAILPMGVIEPHARHIPLGIDSTVSFEVSKRAAEIEPAIVLPVNHWGINHACYHRAGGIVIKSDVVLALLRSLCDEISRNGIKKIIINATGHGGPVFDFFIQTQVERDIDYVVYNFNVPGPACPPELAQLFVDKEDCHAGEKETSEALHLYEKEGLVDMATISKERFGRTKLTEHLGKAGLLVRPLHWFGEYPTMQSGHGKEGTVEKGEKSINHRVQALVKAIRVVKEDTITPALLKRYKTLQKSPGSGWDLDILNGIWEGRKLEAREA